jgi:competence protein ComEA
MATPSSDEPQLLTEPEPPNPRRTFAMAAILALTAVAVGLFVLATRPQPVEILILPAGPTATAGPSATPAPVTVYVTGRVAAPDVLYSLPAGSRVEDALRVAGGLLDDADAARVNRAALLRDGDQIHVPALSEPELPTPTSSGGGLVNVNTATLDELTTLPSIGPVTAASILEYRETNGLFADLAALDAVNGIGPATLDAIAELVTFE